MSDMPTTITSQQLADALELLGIPQSNTRQVTIYPNRVVVIRNRRDADGNLVAVGSELMLETTAIAIERP